MLEKGVRKVLTEVSRVMEGGSVRKVQVPKDFRKCEHSKKENDDTNQGVCIIQKHLRTENVYWENTG